MRNPSPHKPLFNGGQNIKAVLSSSMISSRRFGEDIPMAVFMVWVARDEKHLTECLDKIDVTSFYSLNHAIMGEKISKEFSLLARFKQFIDESDFKTLFDVSGASTESFNFYHYVGYIVKFTSWWNRCGSEVRQHAAKNKKALRSVRDVNES